MNVLLWLGSAAVLVLVLSIIGVLTARRWREWRWGQRQMILLPLTLREFYLPMVSR